MLHLGVRRLASLALALLIVSIPVVVTALAAAPTCAGGCHLTGG